jgi:TolB-like protein
MKFCIVRVVPFASAILLLAQLSFAQGPTVNSLSASLADIANRSGRKTVAVVDFTDLKGCVTELGRYMAEDVSVALANNAKGFEVIDRTNLKILMQEHKLASTGIIDPATARKLGQVAGVDALVTGTLAPLSDSVHISAKVLDTETAKMLGGVTVDIPKTRTVEELLANGVSNCGPTPTRDQNGAQGSETATPSSQKVNTVSTAQIGSFKFSVQACRRDGDRVGCFGSVVNQDSTAKPLEFLSDARSYMIDNLGNESQQSYVRFQLGSGGGFAELEPQLPMNIWISAPGLPNEGTSVSLVLSTQQPSGKITFRNIPIQSK